MSMEMPRTHCSKWLAIDGSFCAVTLNDGPETLTAATGWRCASTRTAAPSRRRWTGSGGRGVHGGNADGTAGPTAR